MTGSPRPQWRKVVWPGSSREIVGAEIAGLRVDGAPAWLPGDWIAISTLEADGSQDLYVSRLDGTDAGPLVVGPGSQVAVQVSPDGRALLYRSDETGTPQSYVVSLGEADGRPIVGRDRQRIPVDDVQAHAFSLEGDQIFMVTIDGTLYAVPVDTKKAVPRLGTPERLFQQPAFRGSITFGVAPKGERFLFKIDPAAEDQTLSVLLGWHSRLE